jgi:hypothetical protein
MNIILWLISLSLGNANDKPQDIKGLFKWNLVEIGGVISPPTVNGGISIHGELLQFNYTFIKPRFGFGTAVVNCYSNYDNAYLIFFPLQLNGLIWYNKRGLLKLPFVSTLNGYCNIGIGFDGSLEKSMSLDLGLEYTPGVLINMRFGYFTKIGDPFSSGLYLSINAFLGAVHKIR